MLSTLIFSNSVSGCIGKAVFQPEPHTNIHKLTLSIICPRKLSWIKTANNHKKVCPSETTITSRPLLVRLSHEVFLVSIIDKNGVDINIKFCQIFLKLCLPSNIFLGLATFASTWNWRREARVVLVILLLAIF